MCSDIAEQLRREEALREVMRRRGDQYKLAANLLRRYEELIRTDHDPRRDRDTFVAQLVAELVKWFAGKRYYEIPEDLELQRIADNILNRFNRMSLVQREVCSLFFPLKATGRKEIEALLQL